LGLCSRWLRGQFVGERTFGKRIASVSDTGTGCPQVWLAEDGKSPTDGEKTVVIQGYTMPRPDDAPDVESVVAIPLSLLVDAYEAIFRSR
jgi:hypothetical protein